MSKNDRFLCKGFSRRALDMCTKGTYIGAPLFHRVSRSKNVGSIRNWGIVQRPIIRQEKNIFSMLVSILNKNDLHTTILTYNKDRQNKKFEELVSATLCMKRTI